MPETVAPVRARAIGMRAAAALRRSGGTVARLAGFAGTPYRLAAGEVVWIGASGPMHPRAVFLPPGEIDADTRIEAPAPWAPGARGAVNPDTAATALRSLAPGLAALAPGSGFAPLLGAARLTFPLRARAAEAAALCAAARNCDAAGFTRAALRLIGVGGGLTPSGDDFVGAALFTMRFLHPEDAAWSAAAATLQAAAPTRTHAIAAALFADLAAGNSFAALHDLCAAAADGANDIALQTSARAVAAIGHSSGWDMLAGVLAAAGALSLPSFTDHTRTQPS